MNDIHPPDGFRLQLKGFSTNNLGHGPFGVIQKALKIMNRLPVFEPVLKLPGLKQKIRIVRTAVLGLFGGEGFIDQDPPFPDSLFQAGGQWAMEVAEDQDAPVEFFLQRVLAGFQIDLPETYARGFSPPPPFWPCPTP